MIVVERLTHFIEQRTNELMRKYLKSTVERVSKTRVKEDEETLFEGSLLCFAANIYYMLLIVL